MKSIVNRREKLRANDLPPEIPDVSGFLTPTDYATDSAGGVIKVDSTYAIELTSGGKLKGKEIAYSAYAEANAGALISKATLDNVVANLPTPSGFSPALIGTSEDGMLSSRVVALGKAPSEFKALNVQICQRGDTVWYGTTIFLPDGSTTYNLKGSNDVPNVVIHFDASNNLYLSGSNANGVLRVYGL